MTDEHSVQAHYRAVGLLDRIVAGLREAGKDPGAPTVDDLAPADEFHSAGRHATKDLAALAMSYGNVYVARIAMGASIAPRRHASSQGAAHTRPHTEANGFGARATRYASSSRPSAMSWT